MAHVIPNRDPLSLLGPLIGFLALAGKARKYDLPLGLEFGVMSANDEVGNVAVGDVVAMNCRFDVLRGAGVRIEPFVPDGVNSNHGRFGGI